MTLMMTNVADPASILQASCVEGMIVTAKEGKKSVQRYVVHGIVAQDTIHPS